jgi:hypothetical protein
MATAYTSLLGLALPVTGELSGTWGTTVNDAITSLLDSAVSGTTTISVDADITLSTTTGAANEAREAILLWTAGGTITRNITAPAQSKVYVVINKSSSTQSIVLRGVGPTTGVTIALNEKAVCAWNGSDFVKVSSTVITNLTGTLPVANGGTGLTAGTSGGIPYYSATGTLASSAALASNALVVGGGVGVTPATVTTGTGVVTALGVNTGTAGAFVVNGGALGTPTSGTVTNLTGTASININGTVGATTPAAGTFTTLSSTGNTTIGDAVADTVTVNGQFVNGTVLRSAQTATNTLALAAYDVDGATYTNLVTLTASNTPTLALTSTGVGTIDNMSVGATTASTGAFTTLSASSTVSGTGFSTYLASPPAIGGTAAAAGTFTTLTSTGNTTIGDADTDTITQAASYVTGTQLKSAKTATNTLNLAAYDVDGTTYTNLITLTASNTPTLALTSTGVGTINNMSVGATTASTGSFTTLAASSTVSGTGFSTYLASPPAIGGTTAAAGSFTTLSASSYVTFGGSTPASNPKVSLYGGIRFLANEAASATYTGIGSIASDTVSISTSGSERVRVDTSGNVGIGNTAVNVNDQVGAIRPLLVTKSDSATTIAGSQAAIVIGNDNTTTSNTSQLSFATLTGANTNYYASAAINCIFGARTNGQYPTGQLTFSTSTTLNVAPTEKMRIDASGNVLIGTTTSPAGSKELVLGGDYIESVVAIGTVTTTSTLSLANGTVQTATLTASTACTFTMPTAIAGKSFVLLLKQAAATGNGTATFTSVKWNSSGAPTITATAGKMDILSFISDGTNWYGSYTQGYTP